MLRPPVFIISTNFWVVFPSYRGLKCNNHCQCGINSLHVKTVNFILIVTASFDTCCTHQACHTDQTEEVLKVQLHEYAKLGIEYDKILAFLGELPRVDSDTFWHELLYVKETVAAGALKSFIRNKSSQKRQSAFFVIALRTIHKSVVLNVLWSEAPIGC